MLHLQVLELLDRLATRDKARNLVRPVLEELCLQGCTADEKAVSVINARNPILLCYKSQHPLLESCTWIGSRDTASYD